MSRLRVDEIESRSGSTISVVDTVLHPPIVLTSSTGVTINFALNNSFSLTLSHNPTFTFSNDVSGGTYLIYLNPNGSSRTLTWPGGLVWSGVPLTSLTSGNHYLVTMVVFGSTRLMTSTVYI